MNFILLINHKILLIMHRLLYLLLLSSTVAFTQTLMPELDKQEVFRSLLLTTDLYKPMSADSLSKQTGYKSVYKSPEMGLTNKWGLYKNTENNVIELVIRGTVNHGVSWFANYYAAMIPVKGEIQLSNSKRVKYQLSEDDRATVHAGWTIASLYLMEDIKPKIDSLYQANHREFIVSGHSQGGVLTYLITANLKQMQLLGQLPNDIVFKTYALAPPKPGNLYFAYQYEKMTTNWSYSVSNVQDWVPETPPTTQTLHNFNEINPFSDSEISKALHKIKWPKRMVAKAIYNNVSNPTEKSTKRYHKYLGGFIFKMIQKQLPELGEPTYSNNSDYMRCSNPIILDGLQNQEYQRKFNHPDKVMSHHMPDAYLYLLKAERTTN